MDKETDNKIENAPVEAAQEAEEEIKVEEAKIDEWADMPDEIILTTIDVVELRTGLKDGKDKNEASDDDSESDQGYGDEDDKEEATTNVPAEVIAPK